MEVKKTAIDGLLIIEPKVFGDKRGYFFESFSQREFDEKVAPILGHTINFVQDNCKSDSIIGTHVLKEIILMTSSCLVDSPNLS